MTLTDAPGRTSATVQVSVSHKCSDMDKLMPELLGVPRAVLEHVVFCHQVRTRHTMGATDAGCDAGCEIVVHHVARTRQRFHAPRRLSVRAGAVFAWVRCATCAGRMIGV